MTGAGLVVVYKTKSLPGDAAMSNMMYLQSAGIPVIAIDTDGTANLAVGLRENTLTVDAKNLTPEETETALVTKEGFSYDFIGKPFKDKIPPAVKAIIWIMLVLSAAAMTVFGLAAAGIIEINTLSPEEMTVLELRELPEDMSELEEYAKLEKIILSPSALSGDTDRDMLEALMEKYTVTVREG